MTSFASIIWPAIVLLLLFTVLAGLAYPLAVTGIAQAVFNDQANGSTISRDGEEIGFCLIGQSFVDPETGACLAGYFRGRPSAAGDGYDSSISSGSNYGPTSDVLRERVAADASQIRAS